MTTQIDSQLLQQQGYDDALNGRVNGEKLFDSSYARVCYLQGFSSGCKTLKFRDNKKPPVEKQMEIFGGEVRR